MDWLVLLFTKSSVSNTILVLSLIIAVGMALGRIRIFSVRLGIAGVLFAGLAAGHFGMGFEEHLLDFIREFGLMLFVYTIGVQTGPAFFASFRRQGLKLNIMAAVVVLLGFLTACAILVVTKLPVAVLAGTMSGAVTNTPGLGAAQQIIIEAKPGATDLVKLAGIGYAMSYPFAIFGIILTMLALKKGFKVDIPAEIDAFEKEKAVIMPAPSNFNILVSNRKLVGASVAELHRLVKQDFVISRIFRDGSISVPMDETVLQQGDIVHVVCSREAAADIALLAGDITDIDLRAVDNNVAVKTSAVTSKNAVNRTIGELDLNGRFSVRVTRVYRAGIELLARPSLKLQFGDRLTLVGDEQKIGEAAKELGDSIKELEHPNIIPIFIGLITGLVIGAVPVPIPGCSVPAKLGLAGGTLLAALVYGRIGQLGPLNWFMPHGANLILREVGITMFLACVGLRSGERFLGTLLSADGVYWICLGLIITFLPILTVGMFARIFLKLNYLAICGFLSGSMTNPPALSFANHMTGTDAPSVTYASVYASTMFMRIIAAQILVLAFLR